jgi:hypothetical protein
LDLKRLRANLLNFEKGEKYMGTPATPVTPAAPVKISFWSKLWTDVVKAEHAVVSGIEKAAGDVPEVEQLVATYGGDFATVFGSLIPGAGQYATVGANIVSVIGNFLEAGGTAAEQAFTNMGADQALVAQFKTLWANLKTAAAAKAPATAAPAPAAKT